MTRCAPLLLACLALLCACDQLGIETPLQVEQRRAAEGRAVGGSCRQVGRVLEECYQMNARSSKAAIYDGWKEMDAYMRDNKIGEIAPEVVPEVKAKPEESSTEPKAKSAEAGAAATAETAAPKAAK